MQKLYYVSLDLFHLELAAFLEISDFLSGDKLDALAIPPFKPPSLPNATAAGFFSGFSTDTGATCPVTFCMIEKAFSLMSFFLLERIGIPPSWHSQNPIARIFWPSRFQTDPLPGRHIPVPFDVTQVICVVGCYHDCEIAYSLVSYFLVAQR